MKIKKKSDCNGIPKFNSHSGFSREHWSQLNEGKEVSVDSIPELAVKFVEEVKSKGK
tara:strand:+ start:450 stop:620 length:171 start_codon:yes stop_codon:yes gene_type:complete